MTPRAASIAFAVAVALLPATSLAQAAKFKLKAGAGGQVCLECHGGFAETLKKPFVHTPVKARNCAGCHNPHASAHAKLLPAKANETCATCHSGVIPKGAKSAHAPARDGRCTDCHDPHASSNRFNLVRPSVELCGSCHKEVVAATAKAKFKHRPLEQGGCVVCHDPHGSAQSPDLLKKAVPALCVGCHKTDRPIFVKQHVNYNVSKSDCTSCHDPHGSSRRGILYDNVHPPVAKGMCGQCHEQPGSPNGFRAKQEGVGLCRGCHSLKVNDILAKNRVHSPVVSGAACLTCHAPHASSRKGLLRGAPGAACASCHADTMRRSSASLTKHAPITDGNCAMCHDPHSGSSALLLANPSIVEMCGQCHDWLKHSSHPMGEKAKDPRNPNLQVQCLSCHRAHGTEHKKLLLSATQIELCTKCHEKYQR